MQVLQVGVAQRVLGADVSARCRGGRRRQRGGVSERTSAVWGRDVKHTHRSPPWKRCEEEGRCRGQETGDGSETRHTIDRQWSVLLALVTEGEGLVLTGPLLAVIGDWGGRKKN